MEQTPKKSKAGRKKIILNSEHAMKIQQLASTGLGIMDICRALDISWDVFNREKKHNKEISEALKKGQSLGLAKVTSALFQNATKGNTVAQIFYLKNRSPDDWNDRTSTEININLKEVLDDANKRLSQHKNNSEIIEGESLELPKLKAPEHLPNKKIKKDYD